jgi:DNA polymerase/3'-5' exonuclease PolX
MSKGKSVPLGLAQTHGKRLVDVLKPYCEKIMIAGSVRRERQIVHDLEIVALVKEVTMKDLFGDQIDVGRTRLDDAIDNLWESHMLGWKVKKGGARYKTLIHPHLGLLCDIYVVTDRRAWGSNLAVRTGPRVFSANMMKKALANGMFFENGFLLHNHMARYLKGNQSRCEQGASCEKIIPLYNEADAFEVLKIPYLSPAAREERYGIG